MQSQQYLEDLNLWSKNQKMTISQEKTKAMVFNFTDNYQFSTRLKLNDKNIDIVDKMKILGTIVNNKLTWDDNCAELIKKVNKRMALIRSMKAFGATTEELVHMWVLMCRSVLEQSCILWHTSLTLENIEDLERTQKTFAKLVLRNNYKTYDEALIKLNLLSLPERRTRLCKNFAESGVRQNTLSDLFKKNKKSQIRNPEKFKVDFAYTERFRRSSVIQMQSMLNEPVI